MTNLRLRMWIRLAIGIAMAALTAYYTYKSFVKFVDGKVAISVHDSHVDYMTYPHITVCSMRNKEGFSVAHALRTKNWSTEAIDVEGLVATFDRREDILRVQDLAEGEFEWESQLTLHGGLCHTLKTDKTAKNSELDKISLFVTVPKHHWCRQHPHANNNKGSIGGASNVSTSCNRDFSVFTHQPNAFMYSTGHRFLGVNMELGEVGVVVFLVLSHRESLRLDNDEVSPCQKSTATEPYAIPQWKSCLDTIAERKRGCVLPWEVGRHRSGVSRVCKHSDFFEYADADFDGYKTYLSENVLYELTKCLQPCHYTDFPMERAKYTADHVNEEELAFTFFFGRNVITEVKEYEAFDVFSLVAEMGGFLGLFLGLSFFQMCSTAMDRLVKIRLSQEKVRLAGKSPPATCSCVGRC